MTLDAILSVIFAIIAALYASVGQAGGTGYVAVMGLFGFGAAELKTTALALNILVSAIGVLRFRKAGTLDSRDWYPFALTGIPLSLLGGALNLPGTTYRLVVAVLLLAAAIQMIRTARAPARADDGASPLPPFALSLLFGGIVGFTSGITGVGGGIFLAPLMLWLRWGDARRVAAVSATFNLFNSAAALVGVFVSGSAAFPAAFPLWAAGAVLGGLFGSWLGFKHLPAKTLRYILGVILLAASLKVTTG